MADFEKILNVALPALVGLGSAFDPYGNVARGAQGAWSMRRAIKGDEDDEAWREFQKERAELSDERSKRKLELSESAGRRAGAAELRAGRAEQRTIDDRAAMQDVFANLQSIPGVGEILAALEGAPPWMMGNMAQGVMSGEISKARKREGALTQEEFAQVPAQAGRSQSFPVIQGDTVGSGYIGDPSSGDRGTYTERTASTQLEAAVAAFDSSIASLTRQQQQAIQSQEAVMNDPNLAYDPEAKNKKLGKFKDPSYFDTKKNEAYQELVTKAGKLNISPEQVDAFLAQRKQQEQPVDFNPEHGTEPPPEGVSTVGREQDVLLGGTGVQAEENPEKERIYQELKDKLGG